MKHKGPVAWPLMLLCPIIIMDSDKAISEEYLDLYAKSFARLRFFKIHFMDNHPAYAAEANLLETNESKLRSSILINLRTYDLIKCRPIIESEIKKKIYAKLGVIMENDKVTKEIMDSIKSSDFDSLFNFSK